MFRYIVFLSFIVLGASCARKEMTAVEIIDNSIEAYGGQKVFNSVIEFDFRDKHYYAKYHNYKYSLKRIFSDSTGNIIDELHNDGFVRLRNDSIIALDEEWTGNYSRSVNSVIYFFRIPFVLKDEAAIIERLEDSEIRNKSYYKLKVSFSEDGGGEDFDDTFVYWVNKENFLIDYLAYSYSTDGGGKRFREAINPRNVNGLQVDDYINYEPLDLNVPIEEYEAYFAADGLTELSRIENRNVSIEYLN